MKKLLLLASLLLGMSTFAEAAAPAPSPDIFQQTIPVTIPAGQGSVSVGAFTVPSNKRLVIQTLSYYSYNAAAGSITSVFLGLSIFSNYIFVPAPNTYADGSSFPNALTQMTTYVGAGQNVIVNAYRTGPSTSAEYLQIAVSGYYIDRT